MTDFIFKELLLSLDGLEVSKKNIVEQTECSNEELFIPKQTIAYMLSKIEQTVKLKKERELELKKATTPVKKFLFIEDGSCDADELIDELYDKNPEIKVIVYRQGSRSPELKEIVDV